MHAASQEESQLLWVLLGNSKQLMASLSQNYSTISTQLKSIRVLINWVLSESNYEKNTQKKPNTKIQQPPKLHKTKWSCQQCSKKGPCLCTCSPGSPSILMLKQKQQVRVTPKTGVEDLSGGHLVHTHPSSSKVQPLLIFTNLLRPLPFCTLPLSQTIENS